MLTCEILTTEAQLAAIADEWRDLDARVRRSPVTEVDRFLVWWNTIGKPQGPSTLHIVTGRRDGKLVALLPLTVMSRKGLVRMLNAPGGMTFECDMLCENPADAAELWRATWKSPHYDFAKIKGIFKESASFTALSSVAFASQSDVIDGFFLHFNWPSSKEWMASLSGNTRGNFRRCTRRLEEKGKLSYEIYTGGPLPMAVIDGLVGHKVKWASGRNKHGFFDQPDILTYIHQLTETAARQGKLFLAWLQCGDTPIAYHLGLIDQGVVYAHFWTYDADWSQWSPGNVIMVNTICWALDQKLKGIDFMYTTDSESEKYFKKKYCNEIRPCYEFAFSRTLKGHAALLAMKLVRAAKKLLKRKPAAEARKDESE